MIKAVYPGTFDPLTRGHEDLVRRAGSLFGSLILGIADSKAKRTFFTLQERVDMAREVLADVRERLLTGIQQQLAQSFDSRMLEYGAKRQPCPKLRLNEIHDAHRAQRMPA